MKRKIVNSYKSSVVNIGVVALGGDNPIRIQSMTTTDTMDTKSTVEQSIRIIKAGADYVRITAPSIKEAKNLENIKNEIRKKGYDTPLIADIHFTPNAAETAARIVEKVRVNPGNYADKKKFEIIEYSDKQYDEELGKIRAKFIPLIKICKEYGTAMRIGTNHGSLSDRVMSRYGDTPLGMVEAALEFVRICRDENYNEIVLSMKASNPQVMIEAYRLLVETMKYEEMYYPLHLGVTEAGEGEDGRIKSAIGIGTLLDEGLGDTIRVSLTEEPEFEIPVCKILVDHYLSDDSGFIEKISVNTDDPKGTPAGNKQVPVVILSADKNKIDYEYLKQAGYHYSETLDKWNISELAPDYIYLGKNDIDIKLPGALKKIFDYNYWLTLENSYNAFPLFNAMDYLLATKKQSFYSGAVNLPKFLLMGKSDVNNDMIKKLKEDMGITIIFKSFEKSSLEEYRKFFSLLQVNGIDLPVVLRKDYKDINEEQFTVYSSADTGAVFLEGLGKGIWLESEGISHEKIRNVCFGILQAARRRISKTEYISCPSCGRTLFDLQQTTARIRSRTDHLKGMKIAVMGCIVNGPGEMADADYGYVGSGPGKITLYKGKEIVKRNVDTEIAVDELVNLIRDNGDWHEKQ